MMQNAWNSKPHHSFHGLGLPEALASPWKHTVRIWRSVCSQRVLEDVAPFATLQVGARWKSPAIGHALTGPAGATVTQRAFLLSHHSGSQMLILDQQKKSSQEWTHCDHTF